MSEVLLLGPTSRSCSEKLPEAYHYLKPTTTQLLGAYGVLAKPLRKAKHSTAQSWRKQAPKNAQGLMKTPTPHDTQGKSLALHSHTRLELQTAAEITLSRKTFAKDWNNAALLVGTCAASADQQLL